MSDKRPKVNFDLPWPVDQVAPMRLTSKIYPIISIDSMTAQGTVDRMRVMPTTDDEMEAQGTLTAIELRTLLITYDDGAPEELDAQGTVTSINLKVVLITYDDWPPEELDAQGTVTSIELKVALITYSNYPPESVDAQGAITRIELS